MKYKTYIIILAVVIVVSAGSFFNALRISNEIVRPFIDEYPLTTMGVVIENLHTGEIGLFYKFHYKKPNSYDEETTIYLSPVFFEVSTNPLDLKERIKKMVEERKLSNKLINRTENTSVQN